MDKPISVGDLVQIIRTARCGCSASLGTVYVVSAIHLSRDIGGICSCGDVTPREMMAFDAADGLGCELWRLKRIPPLEELEGEKRDEKLMEPA